MTCSPARLAANRANAQLSTGPKTPEGKERSRANALKHGLCSNVVVIEDRESFERRVSEWFFALKPQDEYHVWLVEKIAIYSMRIDRSERIERRLRDRRSYLAEVAWDDDARLEAERLGARIAAKPAQVVEELGRSPAGCDWLISRWAILAHAAEANGGGWTDEQATLAFHLLGTPLELRQGLRPGDLLDHQGRVIESGEDRVAVARREVDRLLRRREEVEGRSEVDRSLTEVDLFDEANPELKRLRRYEGTLHNRLRWALGELRRIPDHFKPHPDVLHRWSAVYQQQPHPEAAASGPRSSTAATAEAPGLPPKPAWMIPSNPPFDLEADEVPTDGSKPDLFKILLNRQEKRAAKAEARREARRRKLERLRA